MILKSKQLNLYIVLILMTGCQTQPELTTGSWRAAIMPDTLRPDLEIPFNLDIIESSQGQFEAVIKNAGEEIRVNEITITEDSVHFQLPVFEGTLDAAIGKNTLSGTYTHRAGGRSWSAPFSAEQGVTDRFPELAGEPSFNVGGTWEVRVGNGAGEKQIGVFSQQGSSLTGTFLTTTGDYRYLEGKVAGSTLKMSAFDGAHALVFSARIISSDEIAEGEFCGGPSWKGTWRAIRNDTVTLPDPKTLTWLKPGYDRLEFSFPDLTGKQVSLTDERFKDKVVIVQIAGSWCPNCMDETRFFSKLHDQYQDKGLEIIALCYESTDPVSSVKAIKRFRDHTGAGYTFLYAGEANKKKAGETLPMLNRVLSFPTSIFIDKQGKVRQIFTGFSGPGTGGYHAQLVNEMTTLTLSLLEE
jgi:peroxiredoxin